MMKTAFADDGLWRAVVSTVARNHQISFDNFLLNITPEFMQQMLLCITSWWFEFYNHFAVVLLFCLFSCYLIFVSFSSIHTAEHKENAELIWPSIPNYTSEMLKMTADSFTFKWRCANTIFSILQIYNLRRYCFNWLSRLLIIFKDSHSKQKPFAYFLQ